MWHCLNLCLWRLRWVESVTLVGWAGFNQGFGLGSVVGDHMKRGVGGIAWMNPWLCRAALGGTMGLLWVGMG